MRIPVGAMIGSSVPWRIQAIGCAIRLWATFFVAMAFLPLRRASKPFRGKTLSAHTGTFWSVTLGNENSCDLHRKFHLGCCKVPRSIDLCPHCHRHTTTRAKETPVLISLLSNPDSEFVKRLRGQTHQAQSRTSAPNQKPSDYGLIY